MNEREGESRFKLEPLTREAQRRRTIHRWVLGGGGVAAATIIAVMAVLLVLVSPERGSLPAYWTAAVGWFVSFLTLSLASDPLRYLAPTPVQATVNGDGVRLTLRNGPQRFLAWPRTRLSLVLTVRRAGGRGGNQSEFWLSHRGEGDAIRLWRQVVPETRLTGEAFDAILRMAAGAACVIDHRDLTLTPSRGRTNILKTYDIYRPVQGPTPGLAS
jgi:hypothetical protein